MTTGEIRNWLAIIAIIAGGAWSYFQLNAEVTDLGAKVGQLEADLPTSVTATREAAVAAIAKAEGNALRELETSKNLAVSEVKKAVPSSNQITIGGVCLEIRDLVTCQHSADNFTFIDEDCSDYTNYREFRRIRVLAECK